MTIGAVIGGAALLVAAYAFHWRARLLGGRAQGWPEAALPVRLALDLAAFFAGVAGLWQGLAGRLPAWLLYAAEIAFAVYAVVMALNLFRQRAPRSALASSGAVRSAQPRLRGPGPSTEG